MSQPENKALERSTKFYFDFKNVDFQYETYNGISFKIKYIIILTRYSIVVTVFKKLFGMKLIEEKELIIMNPIQMPEIDGNTKMEVGIQNFIQLEYEIFRNKFFLSDCVLGKIYFIKINIPVKTMEIHLFKNECIGKDTSKLSNDILIGKFEIMDGSASENEIIPIRMYLDCYELTPTCNYNDLDIVVNYYMKFVILDIKEKVYFKHQNLYLWRKSF